MSAEESLQWSVPGDSHTAGQVSRPVMVGQHKIDIMVSEQAPGMGLHENSEYENTPRKQEDSWGLSFFKNLELSLECVYTFLPGVLERSCVYFKFLTTACCCYSMKCLHTSTVKLIFCYLQLVIACSNENLWRHDYVTFFNPRSIDCQRLWIKWSIACDFNLHHVLAPLSQIPPPLKLCYYGILWTFCFVSVFSS